VLQCPYAESHFAELSFRGRFCSEGNGLENLRGGIYGSASAPLQLLATDAAGGIVAPFFQLPVAAHDLYPGRSSLGFKRRNLGFLGRE